MSWVFWGLTSLRSAIVFLGEWASSFRGLLKDLGLRTEHLSHVPDTVAEILEDEMAAAKGGHYRRQSTSPIALKLEIEKEISKRERASALWEKNVFPDSYWRRRRRSLPKRRHFMNATAARTRSPRLIT